jgi:hypothetical protein
MRVDADINIRLPAIDLEVNDKSNNQSLLWHVFNRGSKTISRVIKALAKQYSKGP